MLRIWDLVKNILGQCFVLSWLILNAFMFISSSFFFMCVVSLYLISKIRPFKFWRNIMIERNVYLAVSYYVFQKL